MFVSVVIPSYNHERYVAGAIESVLRQSHEDLELIVVDDGSRDNSAEVIRSFRDPRLRPVFQENAGAHAALNRGVEEARGEVVAVLNSDDAYREDKLSRSLEVLRDEKGTDMVVSDCTLMDGSGNALRDHSARDYYRFLEGSAETFLGCGDLALELLAGNFLVSTSNIVARRNILGGERWFAPLRFVHDWDFYFRMSRMHRIRHLEEPLFLYRYHEENTISKNDRALRLEEAFVLADHLASSAFLSRRELDPLFPVKFSNSLFRHADTRIVLAIVPLILRYGREEALRVFQETAVVERLQHPPRSLEIARREGLRRVFRESFRGWKLLFLMPAKVFWLLLPERLRDKVAAVFRHIERTRWP